MDSPNDIYRKEEAPLLVRRKKKPWLERGAKDPDGAQAQSAEGQWMRRSRRQRSHRYREEARQMSFVSRLTAFSLAGVFAAYLLVLGISALKGRRQPPPVAAATAPQQEKPAPPEDEMAAEVAAANLEPIEEKIRVWRAAERALEEAGKAYRDGQFEQSRGILESAVEQSPFNARLRLALARNLLFEKKYEQAKDEMLRVIASDPSSVEARQLLAEAYTGMSWNEHARKMAAWVLESDPYSAEAHKIAAQAALNMNAMDDAITHLRKLVNMNRGNRWARNNLGQAFLKTGQLRDARKTFEEIIKDDANDSAAHFHLAVCESKSGSAAATVSALSRAAQLFGNPFVESWLKSAEFDAIRSSQEFTAFANQLAGTTEAPAAEEAPAEEAQQVEAEPAVAPAE